MDNINTCIVCGNPLPPRKRKLCGETECRLKHQREANRLQMRSYRERKPEIVRRVQRRSYEKNSQSQRERQRRRKGVELLACAVCGREFEFIGGHLVTHGMAVEDYRAKYPDHALVTEKARESRRAGLSSRAKFFQYGGAVPDDVLFEFLSGAMLGDGSLEKKKVNARYAEGGKNESYLRWKHDFLRRYFPCTFRERLSAPHTKSGKRYRGWWVRTTTHPLLTEWHGAWYEDGRKTVPFRLLEEHLSAFGLAVWVCDDGHVAHRQSYLYTMAFSKEEAGWLRDLLGRRFGLDGRVALNKPQQPFLRFGAEDTTHLRDIIRVFEIPGMQYKYRSARRDS